MVKEKSDKLISVYHYTNSRHYDSMINGNEDFAHHDINKRKISNRGSNRIISKK